MCRQFWQSLEQYQAMFKNMELAYSEKWFWKIFFNEFVGYIFLHHFFHKNFNYAKYCISPWVQYPEKRLYKDFSSSIDNIIQYTNGITNISFHSKKNLTTWNVLKRKIHWWKTIKHFKAKVIPTGSLKREKFSLASFN